MSLYTGYIYEFSDSDKLFLENVSLPLSIYLATVAGLTGHRKFSDMSKARSTSDGSNDINIMKLEELRSDPVWVEMHRRDYVAIAAGELVAVNPDMQTVIEEALAQYPKEKRLITKVVAEAQPERILTPFLPGTMEQLH